MFDFFTWTPLELAGNFFIVACIFLAGRNSIHTWWTGLVGCTLFGIMFFNVQLYADATLQVFFFITGLIGWYNWTNFSYAKRGMQPEKERPIEKATPKYMGVAISVAVLTALAYGALLHSFTDAYAPWIDSAVLTFSVVAQLLLMRRAIQNWQVWVLVNTLSVPLFWSRELYLTSVLYGAFWINAVYSYFHWKKLMKAENEKV